MQTVRVKFDEIANEITANAAALQQEVVAIAAFLGGREHLFRLRRVSVGLTTDLPDLTYEGVAYIPPVPTLAHPVARF